MSAEKLNHRKNSSGSLFQENSLFPKSDRIPSRPGFFSVASYSSFPSPIIFPHLFFSNFHHLFPSPPTKRKMVLTCYLWAHFQSVEKPKGGPLEIEIFFVEGGKLKGLEGGQEPSKTPSDFFSNKKIRIENVLTDNT